MKTELLFYTDSYLKSTFAKVIGKVEFNYDGSAQYALVFDKTVFYPEGGGQSGDKGTFGSCVTITNTIKGEGEWLGSPLHVVSEADFKAIQIGDEGELAVNWSFRYLGMQSHSAQHLISAVLFHNLSVGTLSVHFRQGVVQIETDAKEISQGEIDTLLKSARNLVEEGKSIKKYVLSNEEALKADLRRGVRRDGDIRVVEIEGFDKVACAGVHLDNTSEIGPIVYTHSEKVRGHIRLFFYVAKRALLELYSAWDSSLSASRMLSTGPTLINEAVEDLLNKYSNEKEKCDNLTKHYLNKLVETSPDFEGAPISGFLPEEIEAKAAIRILSETKRNFLLFKRVKNSGSSEGIFLAIIGNPCEVFNEELLTGQIYGMIGAKGGGKNGIFQGKCDLTKIQLSTAGAGLGGN